MSKQLISNYTFSTSAKTITLTDFTTIRLDRLRLITDATTNKILYNFADSSVTTATVATNVITLAALQGGEANGDKLQIDYDTVAGDPSYSTNGDVVAGDAGFNGVATASATKTYTFTTSASGAQTILANTPIEGYGWIEVVYTSVGSGLALAGQFSTASGGTYVIVNSFQGAGGSAGPTTLGTTVNTIYTSEIHGNYFQIAVSALTSGTFAGTVTLHSGTYAPENVRITQSGTLSVGSNSATGSAVPANAFFVGINGGSGNLTGIVAIGQLGDAGTANSSPGVGVQIYNGTNYDRIRSANSAAGTTGTGLLGTGLLGFDGTNYQRAFVNALGGQFVQGATKNSAVAVSASPTVVKNSAGYLSGVIVSAAGTAQAMTIYDNASAASGTVIGFIPTSATAGSFWPFNMPATNGITCSGSANNPAVTVAYA